MTEPTLLDTIAREEAERSAEWARQDAEDDACFKELQVWFEKEDFAAAYSKVYEYRNIGRVTTSFDSFKSSLPKCLTDQPNKPRYYYAGGLSSPDPDELGARVSKMVLSQNRNYSGYFRTLMRRSDMKKTIESGPLRGVTVEIWPRCFYEAVGFAPTTSCFKDFYDPARVVFTI